MDQELFAVHKSKAMAFALLDTTQPWVELEDGQFAVRIKDPAMFARRCGIAFLMEERYKNRDNIIYWR